MSSQATPPVVDRAEYDQVWAQQIAIEKELTHHGDRVSARRRRLPMTPMEDYELTGPDGPVRISELFGDNEQLVLQHFMFHPDWTDGCPSCTWALDNIPERYETLLGASSVGFAVVARAPYETIADYQRKRGWDGVRFLSSAGTTLNADWDWTVDDQDQPGYSYLLRTDDGIFLTYRTLARGTEAILATTAIWDRAIYGRRQDYEDSPEGWPQEPTYG